MSRLERAEERDSQRDVPAPNFGGITLDNWEQRSKGIARMAIRNEAAEVAAKQRLGLLPGGGAQVASPVQPASGWTESTSSLGR